MNAFETHGVRHLSASSLNTARYGLDSWVAQYLFGQRGPASLHMWRGVAGEDGVAAGLSDPDMAVEDAIAVAERVLRTKTTGGRITGTIFDKDEIEKTRQLLAGYSTSRTEYPGVVRNALGALRPYGVPSSTQEKIEVELDGVSVPLIGYKDFSYDDHGMDVDLKCPGRLPAGGVIPPDHRLQGAIYWAASGNRAQRFCYATAKEATILELDADTCRTALRTATGIARTLERFLSLSKDREELAGLVIPDYSGYRWSPSQITSAQEIFGY